MDKLFGQKLPTNKLTKASQSAGWVIINERSKPGFTTLDWIW